MSKEETLDFEISFQEFRANYSHDFGDNLQNYVSAPEVTENVTHRSGATVSAPYKVGKDTLIVETGIPSPVSDASRAKRGWEIDGVHYNFTGYTRMLGYMALGEYFQIKVHPETKEVYGTRYSALPSEGLFVMDVMADEAQIMQDEIPFERLTNTYLVCEPEQWDARRKGRDDGLTGEALAKDEKRRLAEAELSLTTLAEDTGFIVIENSDLSVATGELIFAIEHGESQNPHDQIRLRNIANKMLHYVYDELGRSKSFSFLS